MPLTIEEIRQGISENPDLKTAVLSELENDAVEHIKTKGRIVRTADEEKSFLQSYETQKIDPRIKKIYDDFDADIEAATGQKKPDGVKTYQHLKSVLTDLSTKSLRAKDLESEIEQLKAGKVDDLTKTQLKQLQDKIAEKEIELTTLQDSHKKQLFSVKHKSTIEKALAGVKVFVPEHVPEADREAYINSRLAYIESDFNNRFKVEETENGGFVYKDAEGVIQTNSSNAAPKTATDLISETYKFEFEQADEREQLGAGSQGKGKVASISTSGIKDKAGIYEYASKKGLVMGGEEWTKAVEELAKKLNISLD